MKVINGFFMAWGCFCRIPCPRKVWDENARKEMLLMLPVLGLLLGWLWFELAQLMILISAPIPIAAAVLAIYPFLVSGFIHLDGFMDCSDAICSRAPIEKRLEILKDSHVGAFAVIWAIIAFLVFFAAIWSWLFTCKGLLALILIPMASRTISAYMVLSTPSLSSSQYTNMAETRKVAWVPFGCLAIALAVIMALTFAIPVVVVVIIAALASLIAEKSAVKNLGGMSGDISGYGIVWGELIAVIAAAFLL